MASKRTDRRRAKAQRHPDKAGTRPKVEKSPQQIAREARHAEKRAQRERDRERNERTTGPLLNVRHASTSGLVIMYVCAWVIVAIVAFTAAVLGRWDTMGYPDTLWLWVAVGVIAASAAVGRVAIRRSDVTGWAIQGGLVSLGALIAEMAYGPSCTPGNCAAVGARGSFGAPGAVLIIIAASAIAWGFGLFVLRVSQRSRPRAGRVRTPAMMASMAILMLCIALPLAAAVIALDAYVRPAPTYAKHAIADARTYCFSITDPNYDLSVRPYPDSEFSDWQSYLVRRTNENRTTFTAAGKPTKLPTNYAKNPPIQPYEALVTYAGSSRAAYVECRLINPNAGKATPADANPPAPSEQDLQQNPLNPPRPGSSSSGLLSNPNQPAGLSSLPGGAGGNLPINVSTG